METWHITLSSASRLTLFPTAPLRAAAAACVVRVCGGRLLMFEVPDDHVHIEVVCSLGELGGLRSATARALSFITAVPLAPSHVQPVRSRAHLVRNVRYFLDQASHHGIARSILDPGSCFQDLVGARILPGFDPGALKRALPRLTRSDLLQIVRLPAAALEPATDEELRRAGTSVIARLAAEALGLHGALEGLDATQVLARRVAARVCGIAGLARRDLRREIAVSDRTVRRLARADVAPQLIRAVRVRLSIESCDVRRGGSVLEGQSAGNWRV